MFFLKFFTTKIGGRFSPFDVHIFSDGLVQPAPSFLGNGEAEICDQFQVFFQRLENLSLNTNFSHIQAESRW